MSLLQPRLSVFSLLGLGARFSRTGAHAAVMTPHRRLRNSGPMAGDAHLGWDLIAQEHRVRASGARIMHLFGEVLNFDGAPVQGAVIEIRQCDMNGRDASDHLESRNFRGIGRAVTDFEGRYQFRTILPTAGKDCPAQIDAQITPPAGRTLTTRLYLLDHASNETDWNYLSLGPSQQAAVSLDPVERADGDLDAGFNFVL